MKTIMAWGLCILALLGTIGCEESIAGVTGPTSVETNQRTTESGTLITTVDATSKTDWIYYSFSKASVVDASAGWDIAFQRSLIKANSGVSGNGSVIIAHVDVEFEEVTQAPNDGYRVDTLDDAGAPVYAFDNDGSWYNYDINTHILTPKVRTYIIRGAEAFYKFKIHDYYGTDAKTSAVITFEWGTLEGPDDLVEPGQGGAGSGDGADS